jgi:integrase
MPRPAGLRIEPRINKTTAAPEGFTIVGSVAGVRIRRRAQANSAKLAHEEAAALQTQLLREAWHGERRGVRRFIEAAISYLEAEPRSEHTKSYVRRIIIALGDKVTLGQINRDTAIQLRRVMLPATAQPATYLRHIITPLRAIMRHAAEIGWCDVPVIKTPRSPAGRTRYLLPEEATRLVAAAAPHLRPLLLFLLGTGARIGEAIYLDWRDVDLVGGRAIFWANQTKSGKRRNASLPLGVVAALANLGHREGPVFLTDKGQPYADRRGSYGGQIKTGWRLALARAGLDPELSPHDLRHTWASWQYALDRDLLRLKLEGGWSSVVLCERYAHLLPAGHQLAIQRFFGHLSGIETDNEHLSA